MRWTYLIPRLVILGLIYGFFIFGFDPLLKNTLQSSVQSVTGAKVDVGEFRTGFFPPTVHVGAMSLASRRQPGTNLIEFDEMAFRIAGDPLLRRSFVVDEASVTGVRFGTARNDSGQLEVVEEDDESGSGIPDWLSEKIDQTGSEWLDEFTERAEAELSPESLETYRVGQELYGKWDARFDTLNSQLAAQKVELQTIRQQIELAKKAPSIDQIEQYLTAARRAESLMRQANALMTQLRNTIPQEIKTDYARLDTAQQNDRRRVTSAIDLVRNPDPRRITESLIGEDMYRQLHQLLSWVEFVRDYQKDLRNPAPVEQKRGQDFEFQLLNPTPGLLCRKMAIEGELMLGDMPTPFAAVLTDVTSDPRLHGHPAVLRVTTEGEQPMSLVVRHDATGAVVVTDLGVDYVDGVSHNLSVGQDGKDHITAQLRDVHWKARLTLIEDRLEGNVDVAANFESPRVELSHRLAGAFAELAEKSLGGISEVRATLDLTGTIRKPEIDVKSNIGPQFVSGFENAFGEFLPVVREQLVAELDAYVLEQKKGFSEKLGARYQDLLGRNQDLLNSLQQAQQIAMDLRAGRLDADRVFRLASENGLLKEDDQKKVGEALDKHGQILKGMQNPQKTIQDAIPRLRGKLFR